jgi:uncharacterized phage infection (PIP) family protein YhgE
LGRFGELNSEAAKQAEQMVDLTRAVIQGDRDRVNQMLPQSLQVPDSPKDYDSTKREVAATHDKYAGRVNPNQFSSKIAEEAQAAVKGARGAAYHYYNEAKNKGKETTTSFENTLNEAEGAISKVEDKVDRNKEGLKGQYDDFAKQIENQIANLEQMRSSPELKKAFEALQNNADFKKAAATLGISKFGEFAQWAAQNKDLIKKVAASAGLRVGAAGAARVGGYVAAAVIAGAMVAAAVKKMQENADNLDYLPPHLREGLKERGAIPTAVGTYFFQRYHDQLEKIAEEQEKTFSLDGSKVHADPQSLQEVFKNADKVK